MPVDYQSKKKNPYLLPRDVYGIVRYQVRDYNRKKQECDEILHESPLFDGLPKGNEISNPTESKAMRREKMQSDLKAIEQALVIVPEEYRKGVFDEARYGGGFPIDASRSCYQKWKQRFMRKVAENMFLI